MILPFSGTAAAERLLEDNIPVRGLHRLCWTDEPLMVLSHLLLLLLVRGFCLLQPLLLRLWLL